MLEIKLSLAEHSYFAAVCREQLNLSMFVYFRTYLGSKLSGYNGLSAACVW